jgi:hypothetical protein
MPDATSSKLNTTGTLVLHAPVGCQQLGLIGVCDANIIAFHITSLWCATAICNTYTMALRFAQRAQAGVLSGRQQAPAPVVRVPSATAAARCNVSQMAAIGALASFSSSRANQAPVVRCR